MLQEERKLKKALEVAARSGARFAVIIGEEELAQDKIALRDLHLSKQESLSEAELLKKVLES